MIVAVTGFLRVDELARFRRIRASAVVFSLLALLGVLALGVLQGLVVTAGLSLAWVIRRFSRPGIGALARDPATGAWGRADNHPGWERPPRTVVIGSDGLVFYPNAVYAKERILAIAGDAGRVVLDLSGSTDLDVQTLDAIGELADAVPELWLAAPHVPAVDLIGRAGLDTRVRLAPTLDAAVAASPRPGDPGSPPQPRR